MSEDVAIDSDAIKPIVIVMVNRHNCTWDKCISGQSLQADAKGWDSDCSPAHYFVTPWVVAACFILSAPLQQS